MEALICGRPSWPNLASLELVLINPPAPLAPNSIALAPLITSTRSMSNESVTFALVRLATKPLRRVLPAVTPRDPRGPTPVRSPA